MSLLHVYVQSLLPENCRELGCFMATIEKLELVSISVHQIVKKKVDKNLFVQFSPKAFALQFSISSILKTYSKDCIIYAN